MKMRKSVALNLHILWTWPLGRMWFCLYERMEIVLPLNSLRYSCSLKWERYNSTYWIALFWGGRKGWVESEGIHDRCRSAVAKLVSIVMKYKNVLNDYGVTVLHSKGKGLCHLIRLVASLWKKMGKLALRKISLKFKGSISISQSPFCLRCPTGWKQSYLAMEGRAAWLVSNILRSLASK